jgi:hypothetical protein
MSVIEAFKIDDGENPLKGFEFGITLMIHQHKEPKTKWHAHINIYLVVFVIVINIGSDDIKA